jgi:hypothetical protein
MFILFGIAFVISPETFSSVIVRSSTIIFLAGCIAIVFFGFVGFLLLKKLIDNTPGLIISENGITDNSSGVPAGFIPWSDIVALAIERIIFLLFYRSKLKLNEGQISSSRV